MLFLQSLKRFRAQQLHELDHLRLSNWNGTSEVENNVIQPFVKLEDDVIIWTGNVISHHTTIMKHCFIVSHTAIAGNTTIEPYCFIGMNATIRNSVRVAKECVIGAGSVILHDTNEKEVYAAHSTVKLEVTSNQLRNL